MCGRFAQISSPQAYAELFGINSDLSFTPRYNVTPASDILACRLSSSVEKELVPLHWGLVPSWSKGLDKRFNMINARAETVASKPAYRTPFRRSRCLIPVDGFYEWSTKNGKQPYYIYQEDNSPLALAGLWESWSDEAGDKIESCSIITTEANELMLSIHDRMPVILKPNVFENWLSSDNTEFLQSLLLPYDGTNLQMHPISKAVNSPKNDSADLLTKI